MRLGLSGVSFTLTGVAFETIFRDSDNGNKGFFARHALLHLKRESKLPISYVLVDLGGVRVGINTTFFPFLFFFLFHTGLRLLLR